jgi:hypothetical protein
MIAARKVYIAIRRPIAREQLGKQTRKQYATNNRVDQFQGNARITRTQQ